MPTYTAIIHYITPSRCMRALEVILNKKLSWQSRLQHIKLKPTTQINVLSRLTASTRVPPYGSQGCSTSIVSAQQQ
jgi:hypothetical protein